MPFHGIQFLDTHSRGSRNDVMAMKRRTIHAREYCTIRQRHYGGHLSRPITVLLLTAEQAVVTTHITVEAARAFILYRIRDTPSLPELDSSERFRAPGWDQLVAEGRSHATSIPRSGD
jgi:hypothetical protein